MSIEDAPHEEDEVRYILEEKAILEQKLKAMGLYDIMVSFLNIRFCFCFVSEKDEHASRDTTNTSHRANESTSFEHTTSTSNDVSINSEQRLTPLHSVSPSQNNDTKATVEHHAIPEVS